MPYPHTVSFGRQGRTKLNKNDSNVFDLILFNLQATAFLLRFTIKQTGKKLEQEETFGCLSDLDEIHAWLASEPSQLLLVYTDLFWMLCFLKCFQAIISFSICTLLQSLLNLFQSSQVYRSKENTFLSQNMALILFRYILQFSHTSSPTEFEGFAKLSVLNNSLHN